MLSARCAAGRAVPRTVATPEATWLSGLMLNRGSRTGLRCFYVELLDCFHRSALNLSVMHAIPAGSRFASADFNQLRRLTVYKKHDVSMVVPDCKACTGGLQ